MTGNSPEHIGLAIGRYDFDAFMASASIVDIAKRYLHNNKLYYNLYRGIPMSLLGFCVTLLASVMTVAANILLRFSINSISPEVTGAARALRLIATANFILGLLFYAMAMLPWLWVISHEPVGSAYTILVATTFILLLCAASIFFAEPITASKALGVVMIVAGIGLVGKS